MIIHWHLLAEQLQQQGESLEEELRNDVTVLAGQAEQGMGPAERTAYPQEQDVLHRLRSRLGNFALQQLLAGQPAEAAEPKEQMVQARPVEPKEVEEPTTATPRAPAEEPDVAAVPGRRASLLLRQILIGLPDLPVPMLVELAALVEQAPALTTDIVEALQRRINDLTPAARDELMKLIDHLPRSVLSGSLMAALLARLRATAPPPVAPAAPAAPEE